MILTTQRLILHPFAAADLFDVVSYGTRAEFWWRCCSWLLRSPCPGTRRHDDRGLIPGGGQQEYLTDRLLVGEPLQVCSHFAQRKDLGGAYHFHDARDDCTMFR